MDRSHSKYLVLQVEIAAACIDLRGECKEQLRTNQDLNLEKANQKLSLEQTNYLKD